MSKPALVAEAEAEAARQDVALLESQAVALRAELLALQQEMAQIRRDFSGMHATQLLEANEQLLVAALRAEAIAETAAGKLTEVTRQGQYDPLTETPNRLLMFDRMSHAITLAHRRGTRLAVLFVDLDHFKKINDTLGHATGDQALKLVVQRLQSALRESDTVSRHGGDEFLVLLPEIGHASDAGISARKMLAALSAPSHLGEAVLELGASIGIATFPEDGGDAATLIAAADAAMYCAKKRGRRRFEFHAAVPSAGNGVPAIDVDPPELARPRDEPPAEHAELVLRDLREANEQLLLAALTARDEQAKAEATQRRQARLLSIMAHELRNPTAPCRLAMETRRQRFVLALPAAPSQVDADVARLVEVFCKLLDNASDGLPLQGARGSACTDGRC